MVSVEGLRRTGEYVKNVARKSVGAGVFWENKQDENIREQLGQQARDLRIEEMLATVIYSLVPTMVFLAKLDSSSEPQTKQKQFIRQVGGLGLACAEQFPLVVPAVLAVTTQNPLFLFGMLGKPLLNAAVNITSDIIERRAFKRKDLPKAPPGTYDLLRTAYDEFYDPDLKIGVIKDTQGRVQGAIRREKVCAESGGSCMVLYVPIIDSDKRTIGQAHVTEKDVIADINSQETPKTPPKIEDLIDHVKKSLNHIESPALL